METIAPRKRIEYIDALRGFTMLLVVFWHIELFGLGIELENSMICSLFIPFFMPLFFFISGFLAYNAKKIWDGRTTLAATKKKLLVLLVPTLVFGLLHAYLVASQDIFAFIIRGNKIGYWFSISLLDMFLIYYGINYIVHKTVSHHQKKIFTIVILALIAIALYPLYLLYSRFPETVKNIMDLFCAGNTFRYFQFFVFGNIAAAYLPSLNKLLDSKFFSGGIIILFFSAFFIYKTMPFDFSRGGVFCR